MARQPGLVDPSMRSGLHRRPGALPCELGLAIVLDFLGEFQLRRRDLDAA
ncbi:hypothetical protein AB1046_23335 [Promicromonospora sp. Populi]